jgi:Uma2 family endonuclease
MSVDEWRELVRTSETRYEYQDGWVYAMAGGTADHARIAQNAIRSLEDALGERPCRVYSADLAVRLSPTAYRFPDVSVTCDEQDRGSVTEVQTPRVLLEVLSESTERIDRGTKLALYRACPSVQTYLLVATDAQGVEVYRRATPHWTYERYGPGEVCEIESIGVQLAVDGLYRRTEVPRSGPSEGEPAQGGGS